MQYVFYPGDLLTDLNKITKEYQENFRKGCEFKRSLCIGGMIAGGILFVLGLIGFAPFIPASVALVFSSVLLPISVVSAAAGFGFLKFVKMSSEREVKEINLASQRIKLFKSTTRKKHGINLMSDVFLVPCFDNRFLNDGTSYCLKEGTAVQDDEFGEPIFLFGDGDYKEEKNVDFNGLETTYLVPTLEDDCAILDVSDVEGDIQACDEVDIREVMVVVVDTVIHALNDGKKKNDVLLEVFTAVTNLVSTPKRQLIVSHVCIEALQKAYKKCSNSSDRNVSFRDMLVDEIVKEIMDRRKLHGFRYGFLEPADLNKIKVSRRPKYDAITHNLKILSKAVPGFNQKPRFPSQQPPRT